MTDIPSTPADGNVKVVWVPTIADTLAPSVAELSAPEAVDVSCYLTGDGWNPSKEQASIADPRLCSRQEFSKPGRKTPSLSVTVIDNTNTEDPNEAVEALVEHARGFFVERRGIAYEEEFAADQKVTVYPVTCGEKQSVQPEANSVIRSTVPMFIAADVRTDVALAA